MERLTKWLDNKKSICIEECEIACVEGRYECPKCHPFTDVLVKLAEYEDLEEQGLLLRLPRKVEDKVWRICSYFDCEYGGISKCPLPDCDCEFFVCEHEIKKFFVAEWEFVLRDLEQFGKTVFLTREEAEQALREMGE